MALYLIGDIQGCFDPLQRLLATLDFSPSRDTLICLGDLVNRGPDSLAVLRYLHSLDGAALCLLGNHDLHLLALAHGVGTPKRRDTVAQVLQAADAPTLLRWLQARPLALHRAGWLLVHAGVFPQWDLADTLRLAQEVHEVLTSDAADEFLPQMYGNEPRSWSDDLQGLARWRSTVNGLTRMRLLNHAGEMEFDRKGDASSAPATWMPWFDHPHRRTQDQRIAFGHWSTLGAAARADILPLDTGCVWGGALSAARVVGDNGEVEIIRQPCPKAQTPG